MRPGCRLVCPEPCVGHWTFCLPWMQPWFLLNTDLADWAGSFNRTGWKFSNRQTCAESILLDHATCCDTPWKCSLKAWEMVLRDMRKSCTKGQKGLFWRARHIADAVITMRTLIHQTACCVCKACWPSIATFVIYWLLMAWHAWCLTLLFRPCNTPCFAHTSS